MGENDVSSDDPPLKMTKDGGDIKFPKLGKISSKKDECSSDASPKPLYSNPKRRRIEHDTDAIISDDKSLSQSDIVDVSPVTKSRYGRTHKPKIPEDFLPTDKKVAAILGRSPHKSPGKVSASPSSSTSVEMTKVCQKGRRLHDIFVKKDRRSKGNTESEELSKSINTENVKLEKLDIAENIEDETAALTVMFTPETVKREATSDTSGVLVEKNKALNVEKSSEIDWVIGDLAWARVSGYPFWPCMIALDPQMGNFTRTTDLTETRAACVTDRRSATQPLQGYKSGLFAGHDMSPPQLH
ncbi:hypothetical protein ANN_02190 [Periplaneta americana]|uniref:PWWP domain-containing protein n=1 Tax=Periplaneta americana TaxID=6978 RepID=A0ABQ8TVK2_PERAM|nr:hypothetical protein ANN_02190 [Periplaneta americana]